MRNTKKDWGQSRSGVPSLFSTAMVLFGPVGTSGRFFLSLNAGTLHGSTFRRPSHNKVRLYDGKQPNISLYGLLRASDSTKSEDEGINFQDGRV